jgi:hypothetical protein
MWFTKQQNGFRGWFVVKKSNGTLRTNLLSSSFTATIRSPSDLTGSTFPVTQSAKAGLYRFDVPSAFMVSCGFGEYGAVVEIDATGPALHDAMSAVLRITRDDFDSLSSSITTAIWDEPNGLHIVSGTMGDSLMSASIPVGSISASISVDNAAIADAVWDEALNGHTISGSTGWVLNRIDEKVLEASATLGLVSGTVGQLYDINYGRWKIDETTNQMIFYKDDNVTEVARFDLTDRLGAPTFESPFERTRT